jgi:hypothetical protein
MDIMGKRSYRQGCPRTRVGAVKGKKLRISHVVVKVGLGRIVKEDEVVHHINEDPFDNRIENLQVMTKSEHMKLHHPRDYSRFGVSAAEDRQAWHKCYNVELREKRGAKPARIITKAEYQNIKMLLDLGMRQAEIAKKYKLCRGTITRINNNDHRYRKYELKEG